MTSPPLDCKHGRTMSGVACHHGSWIAHTVERHRAWHPIIALEWQIRFNDVGCDMPSRPLDNTHGQTTLGMASHHHLWTAQTVGWRRAWHSFGALGRQTNRTTSGKECHQYPMGSTHGRHRWAWHAIMALGHHTRSNKSVVACHHSP